MSLVVYYGNPKFSESQMHNIHRNTKVYHCDHLPERYYECGSFEARDCMLFYDDPYELRFSWNKCQFCDSKHNIYRKDSRFTEKFTPEELQRIQSNTKSYVVCSCSKPRHFYV